MITWKTAFDITIVSSFHAFYHEDHIGLIRKRNYYINCYISTMESWIADSTVNEYIEDDTIKKFIEVYIPKKQMDTAQKRLKIDPTLLIISIVHTEHDRTKLGSKDQSKSHRS